MRPKTFIAIYTCEICGEEYDLENCFVPYTTLWCDTCEQPRKFLGVKLVHTSWEWDYIEEEDIED